MEKLKQFLGSAVLGVAALAVLHLIVPFTGVEVPVCRLSLAAAALLGIPGVSLMVILTLF